MVADDSGRLGAPLLAGAASLVLIAIAVVLIPPVGLAATLLLLIVVLGAPRARTPALISASAVATVVVTIYIGLAIYHA